MVSVRVACCAALVLASVPQPQFRSGVERILIDVQVVDGQGRPVPALAAADFDVRIDRHPRRVVSAEFIRAASIDTPAAGAPAASGALPPETSATPGRDFILAIDESSFQTRYAPAAVRAARGFVERLTPRDRVGLYLYPVSARSFAMTPDHAGVLRQLDGVVGTFSAPISQFHLSKAEVIDVEGGDQDVIARVLARECSPSDRARCRGLVIAEAHAIAIEFEMQVAQSAAGLRRLFAALGQDPERKTVVIVSAGLMASDRVGARPDVSGLITTLGEEAARVNATIYVLHMDSSFLEAFAAANAAGPSTSLMRDQAATAGGLDRLAGTAGGTLLRVEPGWEDRAFERVLRETSAYYLLSVEPDDRDRDGRPHFITVKVRVRGVDVRSRRSVVIAAEKGTAPIIRK
jgi:VWFA-related protein